MATQYVMALDAGTTVVWDRAQIKAQWTLDKLYQPEMSADKARDLYKGWKNVVRRVRSGAVL